MSIVQKLMWLLTRQANEKRRGENHTPFFTENHRRAALESVKLILTKGTFLFSHSDEQCKRDLFFFGGAYIEISLHRDAAAQVAITVLPFDSIALEKYLQQIIIDEIIVS